MCVCVCFILIHLAQWFPVGSVESSALWASPRGGVQGLPSQLVDLDFVKVIRVACSLGNEGKSRGRCRRVKLLHPQHGYAQASDEAERGLGTH